MATGYGPLRHTRKRCKTDCRAVDGSCDIISAAGLAGWSIARIPSCSLCMHDVFRASGADYPATAVYIDIHLPKNTRKQYYGLHREERSSVIIVVGNACTIEMKLK